MVSRHSAGGDFTSKVRLNYHIMQPFVWQAWFFGKWKGDSVPPTPSSLFFPCSSFKVIMNFEDLVDMDWLSTHEEEPVPEGTTASEISLASLSKLSLEPTPTACLEPTEPPPPDFAMPTTEQIRQLIEIAKKHLAQRDQELQDEVLQKLSQPETVAPDELVIKKSTAERRPSCTEESLEAMAEAEGLDLKKLTPRERRQLRNKISARNFRVRRKGKEKIYLPLFTSTGNISRCCCYILCRIYYCSWAGSWRT